LARLVNPSAGTVVEVGASLESRYRAAGWTDVDASVEQVEAPSEKPKPPVRRKSSK
jgi:hypothetical protein